jgi:hypothetical protein
VVLKFDAKPAKDCHGNVGPIHTLKYEDGEFDEVFDDATKFQIAMADPENAGTVKKVRIMCVGAVIDCFFLLNLQQPIGRRGKKVPCPIKCYEPLSLCPCVEWQG